MLIYGKSKMANNHFIITKDEFITEFLYFINYIDTY